MSGSAGRSLGVVPTSPLSRPLGQSAKCAIFDGQAMTGLYPRSASGWSMRKLLSGSGPAGAGPDSPGSCDDEHSQGASSFFPGLSTLPGPLTPFYTIIATLPTREARVGRTDRPAPRARRASGSCEPPRSPGTPSCARPSTVSSFSARPSCVLEATKSSDQTWPRYSGLSRMREGRFDDLARMIRLLGRPVPEARPKPSACGNARMCRTRSPCEPSTGPS